MSDAAEGSAGALEGGCLCGAVRYRLAACARDVGYCHCRQCRRSGGGPAMVWATVPRSALSVVAGEPKLFRSSQDAERAFCDACGSQILWRSSHEPDTLDLNVASLDDPTAEPPTHHTWVSRRVSWFDPVDGLPRFAEQPPEG